MITKAELQSQLNAANAKLNVLERYLPWIKGAPQIEQVLLAMGLDEKAIADVLSGDAGFLFGGIIDPFTKKRHLVSCVRVKLKSVGESWEILVNDAPAAKYFEDLRNKERCLEVAAENSEIVKMLWKENTELKMLLDATNRRK